MTIMKTCIAASLVLISLSACAKEPKDMMTAINEYVQPHGITVDVYINEAGAVKPTIGFTQYKPRAGINSFSDLNLSYTEANDVSQCMKNYGYDYFEFKDAKKINQGGNTFYMYKIPGEGKFSNNLYFMFKDGICLFAEGDPRLDTSLSSNKTYNQDKFSTDLLLIYRDSAAKQLTKSK